MGFVNNLDEYLTKRRLIRRLDEARMAYYFGYHKEAWLELKKIAFSIKEEPYGEELETTPSEEREEEKGECHIG